jgi:hypothetical protein
MKGRLTGVLAAGRVEGIFVKATAAVGITMNQIEASIDSPAGPTWIAGRSRLRGESACCRSWMYFECLPADKPRNYS